MNTPCIHINQVRKRYGKQTVLNGVELKLQQGEYLGLVGMNGAGKTTLIKCLLDLAAADAGSIDIFGESSTRPEARSDLAYLPERFMPPYYLSGRDYLDYMAGMHGISLDSGAVETMLAALDFNPMYLDKPVRQLSKGMSQKLGLAACFLSGRRLYILDEPMSGLDPAARACLKRYLHGRKKDGISLFFSTHLLPDVEALCDRVAILHGGVIRYAGTPAECCAHYGADNLEEAYLACVEADI
jgi:ABC-2 type transport system ATP-binding protein